MDWDYVEKEKARLQEDPLVNDPLPIAMPLPQRPLQQTPVSKKPPIPRKRKSKPFTPAMSPASTISAPYRASPELPNHKGFHLTVDVREPTIYSMCQDICQIQNLTDAYCPRLSMKSLLLGDMELKNGQNKTILLFERKTISDL